MPRLCHTVEQILAKLREAEVVLSKGQPVAQVCLSLERFPASSALSFPSTMATRSRSGTTPGPNRGPSRVKVFRTLLRGGSLGAVAIVHV